jgi:hypothetical protein
MAMGASAVLAVLAALLHRSNATGPALVMMSASGEKEAEAAEDNGPEPKKLTLGSVMQLVLAGAGAPVLGELKEVNLDDPDKADFVFELEANNLTDAEGNSLQTKNPGFTDGYVDDGEGSPGFFENLLSGGKLQQEYEEKMAKRRAQADAEE